MDIDSGYKIYFNDIHEVTDTTKSIMYDGMSFSDHAGYIDIPMLGIQAHVKEDVYSYPLYNIQNLNYYSYRNVPAAFVRYLNISGEKYMGLVCQDYLYFTRTADGYGTWYIY